MSVKKKDRHYANNDPLNHARKLMDYILILTRPRQFDENGEKIKKAGWLGEGQPLQAFGIDFLSLSKKIHAKCYNACHTTLKNKETLDYRTEQLRKALEYCDSIYRQLDYCIFHYGSNNKKKYRSFTHCARLVKELKDAIYTRLNKDKLIYEQKYINK